MTDSRTLPRPPQVTMAGWVTIVGSVLVVIGMFEGVATLRSLDTQERVERLLKEPPFSGTSLSVDDWLSVMNGAYVVAAVCAAATAILGWYALARDRRARVALSFLVVPLFLTGLFSGSFITSVVTVSVVMLWTKPARDWFDGRAAAAPAARAQAVGPSIGSTNSPASGSAYGSVPAPMQQRPAFVTARPDAVLYACLTTWIACGLILVFCVAALASLLLQPGFFEDLETEMRRQQGGDQLPVDGDQLRSLVYLSLAVVAAYCAVAIVLAVLTFLRRNWARVALLASAAVSSLFCLVSVTAIVPLVPLAACFGTIYLLLKPEVREWFAAR